MSGSESEGEPWCKPEVEIHEAGGSVVENLLPDKSGRLYQKCYEQFVEWQKQRKTTSVSQATMLAYFIELAAKFKPPSLWAKYSMLKCTILNNRSVNIGTYRRVTAFLSQNGKGYTSTKAKTLQPKDVERFLAEAPDDRYLAIKVALIFGITGACRREELKNIRVHDIEHHDNMIVVKVPSRKNQVPRKFIIDGEFYDIVRKYEALRPENDKSDRYFLTLRNGKCTQQVIGVNAFGAMPKVIAKYLGLEEPEKYTGHTFRRTSATMSGDLLALRRNKRWKAERIAPAPSADPMNNKKKICKQICLLKLNEPRWVESATITKSAEGTIEYETVVNTFVGGKYFRRKNRTLLDLYF